MDFIAPYMSIEDIGTVFVYLNKKFIRNTKRICFWKGNITQFTNPNPELKWIEMTPDLAIGEVKEFHMAGIVGLRLSIHDVTKNGPIDWNEYWRWTTKISKRGG